MADQHDNLSTSRTAASDIDTERRRVRDLPPLIASLVPIAIMLAFVVSLAVSLETESWWLEKERSFFEHGSVFVPLLGFVAGMYTVVRGRFPARWLRWWFLGWTLACLYLAGEEASWGQHYFGWDTPASLAEINKQKETNLHNTSSWLNMQPRSFVEAWILVGGIVVPIVRSRRKNASTRSTDPDRASDWFWPTTVGIAAASMNYVGRGFDAAFRWSEEGEHARELLRQLGSSEGREFFIGLFLATYLASAAVRTRAAIDRDRVPASG